VRLIIQNGKQAGITMILTSLVEESSSNTELSRAHVSTLSDNWLHLSYVINAGERNRALTIVKSRGTGHSNQVRELLLGRDGIRLERVYTEEGAVLMGTMRWQREERSRRELRQQQLETGRRHRQTALEADALSVRIRALEEELKDKQQDLAEITSQDAGSERREGDRRQELAKLREAKGSRHRAKRAGTRTADKT
jgi:circadian clock protein KaiC